MISDSLRDVFYTFDPLGILLTLSIHWKCIWYFQSIGDAFLGSLCSLYTQGISVFFGCIFFFFNFPLHFQPSRNFMGIFDFFFLAKLRVVQRGGLNYMQYSHQVCSRLFIFFSLMVTNRFFFHSLHLPHLFIFSLTPSTKTFCLSFIPSQSNSHLFLQSHLLSQTLSSPSMAPKSKKSSYILSIDAFHLTCQNGEVRLAKAHL